MKSLFAKTITVRPVVFFFLLAGWSFLGTPSASAQQLTNNDFLTVPAGPYVSAAQAMTLLEGQLIELKDIMTNNNSSSQTYKIAFAKFNFFDHILTNLHQGKTVQESLVQGLMFLNSHENMDLPKGKINEFKTEAVDLLT
jgi:hypothetical protein